MEARFARGGLVRSQLILELARDAVLARVAAA
jgi:hypothetical protein